MNSRWQANKIGLINFWYYDDIMGDPYDLNGKTYGLMNWAGPIGGYMTL